MALRATSFAEDNYCIDRFSTEVRDTCLICPVFNGNIDSKIPL